LRCLILAHHFHADVWQRIAPRLKAIKAAGGQADLLVNCVEGTAPDLRPFQRIKGIRSTSYTESPNRGLDIGGTTKLIEGLDLSGYDLVLKLHTKKSPYAGELGERWMNDFLAVLLDRCDEVFYEFERNQMAMISAAKWIAQDSVQLAARTLWCHRMGVPNYLRGSRFVAGSMFWCIPSVIETWRDFGPKFHDFEWAYSQSGRLEHAVERVLGSVAVMHGGLLGLR
jgi:lipopolysaccharide biosynthesis protein